MHVEIGRSWSGSKHRNMFKPWGNICPPKNPSLLVSTEHSVWNKGNHMVGHLAGKTDFLPS